MKITLAALLHDIGKFYQRTGTNLENQYFRYTKLKGYVHAGYTAKFIDKYIKINFDKPFILIDESAAHHINIDGLVKEADMIASGHDRKDAIKNDYIVDNNNEDKANYKTRRMNSIFNEIKTSNEQRNKEAYIPLNRFSQYEISDKSKNLTDEKVQVNYSEEEYKKLFDQFAEKVSKIYAESYEELHHKIYPLIKEYTVTIPANTMSDFSTVSLYDHLKLTAAIASCINCVDRNINDDPFVLFDYDVSGIQAFIYQITEGDKSKEKISKSLRTRSFYVNILADFIAYYIANAFNVSYENILYSSSGRGRLLLPNTKDFEEKILVVCNEVEEQLYKLHNGKLSVIFSYSMVDGNDLVNSNLSDLVDIERKTNINNKKQKFKNIICKPDFKFIEKPLGKLCSMCNIHFTNKTLCPFCEEMINLNDRIIAKYDKFIIEFNYDKDKIFQEYNIKIGDLGNIIFHTEEINKLNNNSYYLSINDNSLGEMKYYARSKKPNISFNDIANIKKNDLGDDKIAAIKMDVDNLGYIFMTGLKNKSDTKNSKDKETISKLLILSRTLDYFFTKNFVDICGNDVYINYAGGDDLVIICPGWNSINLVHKINEEFKKYTSENKSFHISAGIDLFDSVTPIRYAISRAEDNLELSKKTEGKDSFTVLDCTIKNSELPFIIEEINKYEEAILKEKIARGGIYDIYTAIYESLKDKKIITRYMRYIPHIAYSIERNISDDNFKNELKNTFVHMELKEENLRKYKVILAYALLNTRKENNNE